MDHYYNYFVLCLGLNQVTKWIQMAHETFALFRSFDANTRAQWVGITKQEN